MIPTDFIDNLLARIDIIDLIDAHVPLKKGGQNYLACCPFHQEKSPSFTVSPHKQFYHCFGCGAHGTAIGFLMEYQGLSFVTAVQTLASQAGLQVPNSIQDSNHVEITRVQKKKLSLENVLEKANMFYQSKLRSNPKAIDYLKKRGLSGKVVGHYGLGFAPDAWQGLQEIFNPYPDTLLSESGLVLEKENRSYDRFRDRIIFPIRNQRGTVIGFGGRIIERGEPKYLNSPETLLFSKGKELYGLFEARAAIKKANCVLVVEGYMDVVALAQFGIGYAVAALGTATTSEHIKQLMRQSERIYFCFDGDQAGQKAAWRALENALPILQDDKSLSFMFLPAEHDPDSYIRAHGKEDFEQQLFKQSLPLSIYFLKHLTSNVQLSTPEGKAKLIKQSAPLLAQIKAMSLSFLLRQRLSKLVGIEQNNLDKLIGQQTQKKGGLKPLHLPAKTNRLTMPSLAHKQIKSLLTNPNWAKHIKIPEYLPLDEDMACLTTLLEAAKKMGGNVKSIELLEYMRNSKFEKLINNILQFTTDETDRQSTPPTQEELNNFTDGMDKLLMQIKITQLEQLKQKNQETGLNSEETQLLLALLNRT